MLRQRYATARSSRFDLRLRFRIEDVVGRRIYKRGEHEPELTAFLLRNAALEPGDLAVDAGANIGWHSLILDRASPAGVRIFAFEPDPLNHGLLRENVALNAAHKVTPIAAGLADSAGPRTLHLYPHKNRGRHSFLALHDGERVEVQTVTLAGFLDEQAPRAGPLRLLKVDVEGFEYQVLRGAAERLAECRLVVAEYSPASMRRGGIEPSRLIELMAGHGFRPHRIRAGGTDPLDPGALARSDATIDIAWMRPGDIV